MGKWVERAAFNLGPRALPTSCPSDTDAAPGQATLHPCACPLAFPLGKPGTCPLSFQSSLCLSPCQEAGHPAPSAGLLDRAAFTTGQRHPAPVSAGFVDPPGTSGSFPPRSGRGAGRVR